MAESTGAGGHVDGFLQTARRDKWWIEPALTAAGLGGFGLYITYCALNGAHYHVGPYLEPLFSPLLFVKEGVEGAAPVEHAWFGAWPQWWPSWLPASPAMLVVPLPTLFRGTCYYYRKAYYRSFFGLPPGCAVGPMQYGQYKGEAGLLVFQNLHRYALYLAIALVPILFWEAFKSFQYNGEWGVGLGSLLLLLNPIFLAGYTFGCHSWRHLVGGKLNCFSCDAQSEMRGKAWSGVSWLNMHHMKFAWVSLLWFWMTDLYIRLCSMGVIQDPNTWSGDF